MQADHLHSSSAVAASALLNGAKRPTTALGQKRKCPGSRGTPVFTLRNRYRQPAPACPFGANRRLNLSFAYRALVLTLWLPVGLENHLELRHRLQVFEVKHLHQRQARFARLQQPLDLGGPIAEHFTKLKIPARLLSSFNVPFASVLPRRWLLVEKLIRDIHITDRLDFWIKHAAIQSQFRNAAEQIVTRIDRLRALDQLGNHSLTLCPGKTFVERHNPRLLADLSEDHDCSVLILGAFLQITALAFDNPTAF